nr:uncharacterized protein LOC109166477 [Ipomoea trifida]
MESSVVASAMATLTLVDLADDYSVRQIGNVHGLPADLKSEVVLSAFGSFVGRVTKIDEQNFDGSMRVLFQIWVELEVSKPLKKGMELKKDSGEWAKVDFRYEQLPTFCFICIVLRHDDRFCHKRVHGSNESTKKPYDPELCAGSHRNIPMVGQGWVAPEAAIEHR